MKKSLPQKIRAAYSHPLLAPIATPATALARPLIWAGDSVRMVVAKHGFKNILKGIFQSKDDIRRITAIGLFTGGAIQGGILAAPLAAGASTAAQAGALFLGAAVGSVAAVGALPIAFLSLGACITLCSETLFLPLHIAKGLGKALRFITKQPEPYPQSTHISTAPGLSAGLANAMLRFSLKTYDTGRKIYAANEETCRHFIRCGADINAQDRHGETPLMLSARQGHADLVRFFLRHGERRDIRNSENDDAFAIIYPHAAKNEIRYMLQSDCTDITDKSRGYRLIDIFSLSKYTELTKDKREECLSLIRNNADLTLEDNIGCTALWYAISRQQTDFVHTLIQHGADYGDHIERIAQLTNNPSITAIVQDAPNIVQRELEKQFKTAANAGTQKPRKIRRRNPTKPPAPTGPSNNV